MANHHPTGRAYAAHKRRVRATEAAMYDDLAFPDTNPWVREELTLDNTSILLVNTLRFLINEYGFAGVEHTLNLMRNNA